MRKRSANGGGGGGAAALVPMDCSDGFVGVGMEEDVDEDMAMCGGMGDKKRRLSGEQVRALEQSFEKDNKLKPERKERLASDLGLQPRQVAVWFQNRRVRWKTKQLERDYAALRQSFDALRADHDAIRRDKDGLLAEIKALKAKLGDDDAAANISTVKEELAASCVQPTAAAAQGSSDSYSSELLNDADQQSPDKQVKAAGAVLQSIHGHQLLKVEDDEAAFLGDEDAVCGGFFADEQPPSLPWWTEPTEQWA